MSTYFIRVPDIEPQTLIHYNEIFKEILKDVYGITPSIDYIDRNKYSLDEITDNLPEDYRRGCTIHCNGNFIVYYGYSYEHLTKNHKSLIEVSAKKILEKCVFIGEI